MLWSLLDKYQEIISNGLDLISFFLATPEILARIDPTNAVVRRRVVYILYLLCLAVFAMDVGTKGDPAVRAVGGFIVSLIMLNSLVNWMAENLNDSAMALVVGAAKRWHDVFQSHALTAGIALFVASRFLAFGVAAHKLTSNGG